MERFFTVLLVLAAIVLVMGALTSVWKRGTWGIVLIFSSGAVICIASLSSYYIENGYLGVRPLFVAGWLYLFIMFFFGTKHIMKIGFYDLKSYENYKRYLKDNNVNGAFPVFILYLGPVLLLSAFGVLIVDIVRRIL